MTFRHLAAAICGVLALTPSIAGAQTTLRPANRPVVTAEHEAWYLEGDPITFDGSFYYPEGPAVFFNAYEMVRTGNYRGIPLYANKTLEPYSVLFVPVGNGLLQPYERRREGAIAGTTGSYVPGLPVQRDFEVTDDYLLQAPAPPMLSERYYELEPFDGRDRRGPRPAAALGVRPTATPPAAPPVWTSLRTALRPVGLNAFYVDYDGARWFNSGPASLVDPSTLTRSGDYHGFPVYVSRAGGSATIYVPVAETAESMMTPYTRRD
jgi:hypothetical protein